jgi:hypothetical protein
MPKVRIITRDEAKADHFLTEDSTDAVLLEHENLACRGPPWSSLFVAKTDFHHPLATLGCTPTWPIYGFLSGASRASRDWLISVERRGAAPVLCIRPILLAMKVAVLEFQQLYLIRFAVENANFKNALIP